MMTATPSPQTVYRRVLASGLSVELVDTDDRPTVLLLGHPSVGTLALDVRATDLAELAACLTEAAK